MCCLLEALGCLGRTGPRQTESDGWRLLAGSAVPASAELVLVDQAPAPVVSGLGCIR